MRSTISPALRQRLFEKYGYACSICGVKNDVMPLEFSHIVPIFQGGDSSEENLTLLCPKCHMSLDRRPKEYEFISFLADLLEHHPDYSNVEQESILGKATRYRADIIVNRREGKARNILLIECKTFLTLSSPHVLNIISQLEKYKAACGDCNMVLAVPATLREQDLATLKAANIEPWDLNYIASNFSKQIEISQPSYYRSLLLFYLSRTTTLSHEQKLRDSLSACNPGKADWAVYQSLIGNILECLFTPQLGRPIPELSDKSLANRRDYIMPNYSDKGFWLYLRERYCADYIVIDAKNYSRKVKKADVLQIANYLKPHGAGLFGLIMTRLGGDVKGCEHTLREQWLVHHKLILILNDDDIIAMLNAKSDGLPPEDILGQKIESFRLSM